MKFLIATYNIGVAALCCLVPFVSSANASSYASTSNSYQELEKRISQLEQKSLLSNIRFRGRVYYTYIANSEDDDIDNSKLKVLKFQASKQLDDKSNIWISFRTDGDAKLTLEEMYYNYNFSDNFNIKFGQMLYPFNIESDKTTNNSSMASDTVGLYDFFSWRGIGATAYAKSGDFVFSLGLYGDAADEKAVNKTTVAARTYYTPYRDGNKVMLIGANYLQESVDDPDLGLNDSYFKKGIKAGLEFGLNWDSFNVQAEYAFGNVTAYQQDATGNISQPDKDISTFYIETSYMLTGESKTYDAGGFEGPNVARPVGKGGFGAFELAARYAYTDGGKYQANKNILAADDTGYQNTEYGAGINWMPINNIKLLLHYVHVENEDPYSKAKDNDDRINLTGRIFF